MYLVIRADESGSIFAGTLQGHPWPAYLRHRASGNPTKMEPDSSTLPVSFTSLMGVQEQDQKQKHPQSQVIELQNFTFDLSFTLLLDNPSEAN